MIAAAAAAARIFTALEYFGKQLLKDDNELNYSINYFFPRQSAVYSFAVTDGIHQLNKDWCFLSALSESIQKRSDAGESLLSVALKIEAAAEKIAEELEEKRQMKEQYWESEFLELVRYCHAETRSLMVEIKEADADLSGRSLFQMGSSPPRYNGESFSSWTKLFISIFMNFQFYLLPAIDSDYSSILFRKQVSTLYNELELVQGILGVCSNGLKLDLLAAGGDDDDDDIIFMDYLLNYITTLIVQTAILSCNYWFHYITTTEDCPDRIEDGKGVELDVVVEDAQPEIDPTNTEFMVFHLHFLIALSRIRRYRKENLVHCFSRYFLKCREEDFQSEVSLLLTSFLDNIMYEEEEEEDVVQSLCLEIYAMVLWTISHFKELRKKEVEKDPILPCSILLKEIHLLKAELFLKKLLQLKLGRNTPSRISAEKYQTEGDFNRIMENMIRCLSYGDIEHGQRASAIIEKVPEKVAYLFQSFETKKISEPMLKNSIYQLLLQIVIFRVESFSGKSVFKYNDVETFFMSDGKDQIALLLEQLTFMKPIVSSEQVTDRQDMNVIFVQVEALLRGIMCLSYSKFINKKVTEDVINKMIPSSYELLDKVNHLKPMLIKVVPPKFPLSKFPKTHQMGFVDFLLTNLEELLKYCPESIEPVKHYIEEIRLNLKSLNSLLVKVSESDIHEHPELKDLGDHVTDIAYKVECVIDWISSDAQWNHHFWFYNLVEELRFVSKQASGIHLTASDLKAQNVNNVPQVSLNVISQDGMRAAISEMMVDLSDEEQIIIDQLTRGSLQRHIVSIVGMAGIGKTTLARKVYNNKNVTHHFHRCAWCYVSQTYDKRELLLRILGDICRLTDEICQMNNEDLESKLRQCLLKNKYLVVMDDVWDAGAWNDFKNSFPDDGNGSRILITSRLQDVARKIESNGDPHSLRPFSEDESWKLLEGKVFQGNGCPEELLLVGKEIAQKCQGLPLAVVAISGLLRRMEKSKELWEKIAEGFSSEIRNNTEARCVEIIELSYNHLPGYLKACFLYLGNFAEEKDIPVSKLLRFWLAEGFIQKTESKNIEDVAEAYLLDLISRNLVMISKRRSNKKVKACRLHDLIRDFCHLKAKNENFFQRVTRHDEPYGAFPSSDYGFEFDFYHHPEPVAYEAYRLSIFLKRNHFVESRPSGPGTRSLIFSSLSDSEPRCPYNISFVCDNFRFLRVLDFECINIGVSFPNEIKLLFLLRYLAVSGYVHNIPRWISSLSKLQTLIVKGFRGKVVLPDTIWCMTSLRHLHVNVHVAFDSENKEPLEFNKLENLVSFSCPSISCGEDTEKFMQRLPNLRKLKCIFFESRESSKNCDQFPRLTFLTQLESLNVFYYGTPLNTGELNLPLNLKELSLSNFRLPWNRISTIGRLPNLVVLKLLSGAFEGQRWDMKEEEFPELKFLKLETLNVFQWNASSYHLPKLGRLVLQNCKNLEEIPSDFANISTLETIEVHWCGQSVENSAKEIGEETEEINVLISSSYSRP